MRQRTSKMASWLREAEAVERRFAEWSARGVIGSARESACIERFGFGVRAAQHRLAVRAIVERYRLTEKQLEDVNPSKLRRLATKPLPSDRRLALSKILAFASKRASVLDDQVRGAEAPQLRKALGAVVVRGDDGYLVALAVERSKGQLVTIADEPFPALREALAFIHGAGG